MPESYTAYSERSPFLLVARPAQIRGVTSSQSYPPQIPVTDNDMMMRYVGLAAVLVGALVLPGAHRPDMSCLAGSAMAHAPLNDVAGDTATTRFRIRYPALSHMPPVTADMPVPVGSAYRFLDSLLRSPGVNSRVGQMAGISEAGSDLMTRMIRGIYVATDYDPTISSSMPMAPISTASRAMWRASGASPTCSPTR